MIIQTTHRAASAYAPPVNSGAASASTKTDNDSMQAVIPPTDASVDPAARGDGSVVKSMRAALAAAGITQQSSGMSQADYEQKLHAFTHAVFDATHAQKQADRSGLSGSNASNGIDMSSALSQLATAVAAGNAPDGLLASFNALRNVQVGATASPDELRHVQTGATASPDELRHVQTGATASPDELRHVQTGATPTPDELRHVQTGMTTVGGGSLQSVLSAMATTATPDYFTTVGNMIDVQA